MAANGISPVSLENWDQCTDVSPEKHDELKKLMSKLQRGATRNWTDNLKRFWTVSNEKRKQIDGSEQAQIEGCIDKLHCAIKVDSQQTLLERLKSIARPLDLTFEEPATNNKNAVIRSKMFKVEISINAEGGVRDVKITHHQGDPTSCEDMIEALGRGNFEEFSQHLQGLMDIYRIPGDISMKSKAYLALECLENDLNCLAQLQSSIKGVANCIHKSPLGILLPRKGGCPMKLIYFVSPYDLLNKNTKSPHPMTVEAITEHGLGQSVTVSIEEYPMIKPLQSMPLMSVISKDGKSLPKFQALTMVNSVELPASFVLVLPQPIPVAMSLVQSIQSVTDLDVVTVGKENTLLNLVLQQATKGKLTPCNEFYVTLPDQQHVYYMSDVSGNSLDQQAVLVSRIPFTHPTSVAQVLNILRQQLMFNTVIGSCIRPYAKQDLAKSVVFELAAMSLQHFTVMFEHPLQDTMVTAELDLTDITNAKFRVCIGEEGETICSDDAASKIFQRCLSIPVTLRSVIFKVSEELKREPTPEPQPRPMEISPSFPYMEYLPRLSPRIPFPMDSKGMLHMPAYGPAMMNQPISMKSPPMGGGYPLPPQHIGSMLPPEPPMVEQERPSSNPLLATLLDQDSPEPDLSKVNDTPVLSKLLEDTNPNSQSTTSLASSVPHPPQTKGTRGRPPKRPRSQSEATKGKSPKIHSDIDHSSSFESDTHHHRQNSVDSDIYSQGSVSSLRQHHPSGASTSSTGSAGGTTVIDLTKFANESPMAILEHMSDNFIPKGGGGSMGQHPDNTDVFMVSDIHNHFDPGKEHDSQNFPNTFPNTVPKNEARSTSLEGILSGSGEVSRTKDLQNPMSRLSSFEGGNPNSSILNSLMRSNSHKNSVLQRQLSMDSNSSFGLNRSLSFQSDSDTNELRTSNSEMMMDTEGLNSSKSCDNSDLFNSSAMISSKQLPSSNSLLESPTRDVKNSDLRKLLLEGKNINNVDKDIKIKSEEGKIKMTIPNKGFFTRPNSSELLDITGGKGTNTFDFNSDDDEIFHDSPNRLSSKAKNSKLYQPKISKSDKYKKKESKSNDSGKRKRDKYEKQEKKYKKKKVSEDSRSSSVEMYSATPVESEDKTSTKLKIFKNNLGISVENSPKHSPSNREKDRSDISKKLSNKDERRSSTESPSVKKSSSSHKSSKSVQKSSSITMSRADSKLMNKTPTIKLKPIAIPSSVSSMAPSRTPSASSPTTAKSQAGSGTPTSTTIGRIGAVSLATSGNSKTGTMTPPPAASSVKVSTPTSAKTPPSVNKTIYSSNKTSASSTSAKSSERKLSQSGSGRVSSSSSKFANGSTKYSGERKGGSPSVSGSRNTQTSSSKSFNSSSKGQSSTSQSFGKTSVTNPANVLSFLTNEKGIASLPRIPKISSASVNSSKTASTTATTVTMVTSVSSISTSAKSINSTQTTNSNLSTSRTSYNTGASYNNSNSKSPINSSLKSPLVGNFNNQVKSGNSIQQGPSKPSNPLPLNRPPNIAPNNLGIRTTSSGSQSKNPAGGKSPSCSNPNLTLNKANSNQAFSITKPNNSAASSLVTSSKSSSLTQSVKSSPTVAPASILKQPVSTIVTCSVKSTPSVSTPSSESQRRSSVTSPTFSVANPVCTAVTPASLAGSGNTPSKSKSRKNSLSAVIDKLTSAKSHVPSGAEGDEKKNKLEHSDSFEDIETTKNDLGHKMSEAGDGNSVCKKSNEVVEKSGALTKTNSAETESNSVSKGDVSKLNTEGAVQKHLNQGASKDTKSDGNSRNLFTSILKNASGSFVPENYKDDKENEILSSKNESHNEEPGVVDLCKNFASPKPSPKQNGPTDHTDSAKNTKDVFKVPTPKSIGTDEKDSEDTENLVVRRKQRISTSKPALSPASDASSPENLIIDFQTPVSPRTLQNRTNSPLCNIDLSTTPEDVKRVNNSSVKACKVISSPLSKSNQSLQHNTSPNMNSPTADVEIDDELMNAAIMGFND